MLDPWRLAPPGPDQVTLQYPRPDTPLQPGPMDVWVDPLRAVMHQNSLRILTRQPEVVGPQPVIAVAPPVDAIGEWGPPQPWAANQEYNLGYQVTPGVAIGLTAAGQQIYVFTCLVPGRSGTVVPAWNNAMGSLVRDYQVIWINGGLYIP